MLITAQGSTTLPLDLLIFSPFLSKINPKQIRPKNLFDLKKAVSKKSFIATGNQRSFGDVALNDKSIISMRSFNKIIHFNDKKGIIELQSGILLKEVLPIIGSQQETTSPATPHDFLLRG